MRTWLNWRAASPINQTLPLPPFMLPQEFSLGRTAEETRVLIRQKSERPSLAGSPGNGYSSAMFPTARVRPEKFSLVSRHRPSAQTSARLGVWLSLLALAVRLMAGGKKGGGGGQHSA